MILKSNKVFILLICLCIAPHSVSADHHITLISENYPPLNYEKGGQLTGPSVEIVQEMLNRLQLKSHILVRPWARGYRITTKTPNTCLFSTAKNKERENQFKWIGPLAEKKYSFYAKKDSQLTIHVLADAKPLVIGVQRKGTNEEYLQSRGFTNISNVTKPTQNLQRLMSNRIDLWYTSNSTMQETLRQLNVNQNELKQVYLTHTEKFYIACNKNTPNSVVSAWQNAYDELLSDGQVKKIFGRYHLENLYSSR